MSPNGKGKGEEEGGKREEQLFEVEDCPTDSRNEQAIIWIDLCRKVLQEYSPASAR